MSVSSHRFSGDDLLYPGQKSANAPADATLVRAKPGGARPYRRPEPSSSQSDPEPYGTEPLKEEKTESKVKVRLSNPRWLEEKGEFEATATACVDGDQPKGAATRVVFEAWAEWGQGQRMELPRKEDGYLEDGKAQAQFILEAPTDAKTGKPVSSCNYFFRAKHSQSDAVKSGPLDAAPGVDKPFEGVMFYSPSRDEYLVLPEEGDFKPLWEEIQQVRSLRDKSRLAWENPDPSRRSENMSELEKESEALFGGKKVGDAKSGVEELLLIQGNPKWGKTPAWVHIPSHDRSKGQVHVKSHWRSATDKQVQKNLDKLLNPKAGNLKSPFLSGKLKANLFKTEPKVGDLWHWNMARGMDGKSSEDKGKGAKVFTFSAEAAAMRYFAGWDGMDASFDTSKKTLKLGTSGSASAAVFEGKVTVTVDLPDNRGVNILAWVSKVKLRETYLADPKRGCYLKLSLDGSLSTFVGGSVHGALSVSGSFAGEHKTNAEAGGGGFAGARVNGDLKAALNWAPMPAGKFKVLSAIKAGWGASAGAGLEGRLAVEYENGVFRFRMSAAACLGLGLKGDTGFEVDAKEGWEFVGHLLDCLDFHFVMEVSQDAFKAYRNYAFATFTAELERAKAMMAASQAQIDWARHMVGDFPDWLGKRAKDIETIKGSIAAKVGERSTLRKVPPEALGRLLVTVMQTRNPSDFKVIRYILGSTVQDGPSPAKAASGDHKLKWTLRSVSDIVIPVGPETVKEEKKVDALRDGIRIIRDFGLAIGKWKDVQGQESNDNFDIWFRRFLAENGF